MSAQRAPKAPPESIRIDSLRVLNRLSHVIEFVPWLAKTREHCASPTSVSLLWDCFSYGAPLFTLLDLLGAPSPSASASSLGSARLESFAFGRVSWDERVRLVEEFARRVAALEMQGRVPFGEVIRADDLFGGSSTGFGKVLRTVQRLLGVLEASYPGLFVPRSLQWKTLRSETIARMRKDEEDHVSELDAIINMNTMVLDTPDFDPILECVHEHCLRLRTYHERVLHSLRRIEADPALEDWDAVFELQNGETRVKTFGAYRFICANLQLITQSMPTRKTARRVSRLPCRLSSYISDLQAILDNSVPSSSSLSFDTLCASLLRLQDIYTDILEMSWQVTRINAERIMLERTGIDVGQFGNVVLDDRFHRLNILFFQKMLLCLVDTEYDQFEQQTVYPIQPWELGPALRGTSQMNVLQAIPTESFRVLRYDVDGLQFTLDWEDDCEGSEAEEHRHTLKFTATSTKQHEQWCSALQAVVPSVIVPGPREDEEFESDSEEEPAELLMSEDEEFGGRRRAHPRPWSLIARKGPHSETSSFIQQAHLEAEGANEYVLSPGLLATLFEPEIGIPLAELTALSPLPSPRSARGILPRTSHVEIPESLSDLTGQIMRDNPYPQAHGGFADIWKCTWGIRKVAVKVMRPTDPETMSKMSKRLAHELDVWRRLDHPNVLTLLGTTSDFGHSPAMVCPWFENGSVGKYLDRCGDILAVSERLQILCEVAEGLKYLHSFGTVHGDLTGSNILINDQGHACLCDFGLSSLVADIQGVSNITSAVGGAIRWADASLYRTSAPVSISTRSDIYSFGSVTLEILSGRVPYHYIRSDAQVVIELHNGRKPRRPAHAFVSEAQWRFIQQCWADDPDERPDAASLCAQVQQLSRSSLEFRRHTDS